MDNKLNKDFFIETLKKQYSRENVDKILNGLSCERAVTLRINTLKSDVCEIKDFLKSAEIEFDIVKWSNCGLIIKNKREIDLQNLSIYNDGKIYLQSLSSMLPPIILKPEIGEDILDMAAAPGGKTTQIAALTKNQANITACEMNVIRAERLRYNVEKQGANSVYVMQKDSRNVDDYFSFDRILLDAPCSGSGTLNLNDNNAFKYFSPKLVDKSRKTQISLLKKAITVLKKGKELVYSTCSILKNENEDVVNEVLTFFNNGKYDFKIEIVPIEFEGIDELPLLPSCISGTICVCPNEMYEGFFVAKIRKV